MSNWLHNAVEVMRAVTYFFLLLCVLYANWKLRAALMQLSIVVKQRDDAVEYSNQLYKRWDDVSKQLLYAQERSDDSVDQLEVVHYSTKTGARVQDHPLFEVSKAEMEAAIERINE